MLLVRLMFIQKLFFAPLSAALIIHVLLAVAVRPFYSTPMFRVS